MEVMTEHTTGISFAKTENQLMVEQMVRDFAEKHIIPVRMKYDESQEFPMEIFKKMGDLGLLGVLIPSEYGGAGFGYLEYVTVIVELAKADPSVALSMAAHNSLCSGHILYCASEEQKKKYLPKLASGEWLGAWALTEPNTGSDALNMLTTAKKDGKEWALNGSKTFTTNGRVANVAVVMARSGEKGDSHGITAFIIEKGTPGMSAGKKENKLGMRASDTSELVFQNCRVPEENVVGKTGDGFIQAMEVLDGGRISIAALGLGIAKGALEASIKYAKQRYQFGKPIAEYQAIQFKLADMSMEIEAAELLTMRAADMKNRGMLTTKESSMAKYYASEVAVRASTEAVQIFGGYGYIKEFPAEKYYRDSKLCTIGEGTSEIQKMVIARELLKEV